MCLLYLYNQWVLFLVNINRLVFCTLQPTENNKLCLLLKIMVVVYAQLEKRNCRKFCLISSILKLSGVRARSGLNANLKDLSSPGVFRAAVRRCLLVGEL